MIAYQMVETLSTNPTFALTREQVLAKLGPELTADLYVNTSWRDHPPTASSPTLEAPPPDQPAAPARSVASAPSFTSTQLSALLGPWPEPFFREQPIALGSNNWVVSGAHTVTGKPLLSNDMHLGHQMPNLSYDAHLHAGDFDVAGGTLSGMRHLLLAPNQRNVGGVTHVWATRKKACLGEL